MADYGELQRRWRLVRLRFWMRRRGLTERDVIAALETLPRVDGHANAGG